MKDLPRPKKYSLSKKEILRGKRVFQKIFEHGSTLRVGVLNFYYLYDLPSDLASEPLMAGFSVPKRRFKKASTRNLLKRRMREAYRLNRHFLSDALQRNQKSLVFLITYSHNQPLPFSAVEAAMVKGMEKFLRHAEMTKKE